MLSFYRILINFIFLLSPLIIIYRIIKNKEDKIRFKEKLCFISKKKSKGKLIWFHGASVGELRSIVPLLEKLNHNKNISQILVTSNTLSSSKIMQKIRLKKVIHQFFPIDTNFLSNKFLNYWQPSLAIFIDSEIWPNTLLNLKKKNIPTALINGRITKKTFKKWLYFKSFAKEIFSKINLCLSSSIESKNYLKKLGVNKVKYYGNLKFSQSENDKTDFDKNLRKFFNKKKIWCASSTHNGEELVCGTVHQKLKKKYQNLITVIIPRHVDRVNSIKDQLVKLNLKVHMDEPKKRLSEDIDIYLVNTYGKTKLFYNICKNVFLGGSLIDHGGQNPLEATRFGCNILHGPSISNFREIYLFLKKNRVSTQIKDQLELTKTLNSFFLKKKNSDKIKKKLNLIGKMILNKTYKEINLLNKNEIKKT